MSDPHPLHADSPLAQAATWHTQMSEADVPAATREAFERWIAEDADNVTHFERVTRVAGTVADSAESATFQDLRSDALARWPAREPRRYFRVALAASLAIVTIGSAWLALPSSRPAAVEIAAAPKVSPGRIYSTAVGERLTVALPDGSSLTLNTDTRIRMEYGAAQRHLVLEQGEALFEVAKNQARPFTVSAGTQVVTAHGTLFDVRLSPATLQVALIEGRVSIQHGDQGSASSTTLSPRQLYLATGRTASVSDVPDIARLVSWNKGFVIFDDSNLRTAVAEMNRYARKPIRLDDTGIASLRLSGSFKTSDPTAFLQALELYFPLTVRETRDGYFLHRRPTGG